jgi:hypothetical protein
MNADCDIGCSLILDVKEDKRSTSRKSWVAMKNIHS